MREAIERDDFRAANVKRLSNLTQGKFYRAKLDYADRLLFSIVRYAGEPYALMLEVIEQHAYDKSRFLRGASLDEAKGIGRSALRPAYRWPAWARQPAARGRADHSTHRHLANGPRGKRTWSMTDGEWNGDADIPNIRLCDIFRLERHKKLYYDYDPGASWCFEIVRKGRDTNAAVGQSYPCLVLEEGVKPQEYGADEDGDST